VIETAMEVERWCAEHGGYQPALIAATQRLRVQAFRGDVAGAAREVPALVEACRTNRDVQIFTPGLAVAIQLAESSGQQDQARALIEELRAFTGEQGITALYGLHELLPVLEVLGDPARFEGFLPEGDVAIPVPSRSLHHGRAMLDLLRGRTAEAADGLLAVATSWGAIGHVFDQARALLWAGKATLELGRATEAATHLAPARQAFADLGAVNFLARADELLAGALARSS
jgi:hypothetical protein